MKRLVLLVLVSGLLLSGCSSTTREMKYKEPDESMKGATQHTQGTTEAPSADETSAEPTEETTEAVEVPEVLGGSGMSYTAVLNLYNKGVDKTSNWCFSPYSLLDCMSIIAMDVQGDTKAEYDMLGASNWQFFADYDKKLPEGLSISNRAYINEDMKDATNTDFVRPGCDIHVLKFDDAALQLINDNVSHDTNGKIERIFDFLEPDKPSCFVNAVYFNNKWDWEAKDVVWKGDSELRPGFGDDIGIDCVKELSPEIDMVRLEYPGTDFAMYVMCPNHEVEGLTSKNLDSFMENDFSFDMLTPNTEDLWDEALFRMPSFEFSAQPEVQDALMGIGVKSIFGDTADFGQLGRLYVGSIVQKTYVKVNNKGTEAAAATGMMMNAMSAQPMEVRRKSVIVNQDFVFVIKDEAKDVVLFMGRVTDPVGENE